MHEMLALPLEERDVRQLLSEERSRVLRGCRLAFSRCWPRDQAAYYEHPLWRLAEALGADCSSVYQPERTTHLVAAHPGTDKVRASHVQLCASVCVWGGGAVR